MSDDSDRQHSEVVDSEATEHSETVKGGEVSDPGGAPEGGYETVATPNNPDAGDTGADGGDE